MLHQEQEKIITTKHINQNKDMTPEEFIMYVTGVIDCEIANAKRSALPLQIPIVTGKQIGRAHV